MNMKSIFKHRGHREHREGKLRFRLKFITSVSSVTSVVNENRIKP
jgi:hypothetical protein